MSKTVKISIIVPSLRPEMMENCVKSIHNNAKGLDYEVIVISPFDISSHPNVVHITEDKPEGTGKAVYTGYKEAKGEYIMSINDHGIVETPLKYMVECMKPHDDEIYEGRFFTIDVKRNVLDGEILVSPVGSPVIPPGQKYVPTHNGNYFDHISKVFGRVFATLMCIRRDKAEEIGGFFDYPYYKAWYLDPDLSLRVWKAGGKVETCEKAQIMAHPRPEDDIIFSDNKKYLQRDKKAFEKRWGRAFSHEA